MIVELRERIAGELAGGAERRPAPWTPRALAREGLVGLGYDLAEAEAMLDDAAPATPATTRAPEELIAAALRDGGERPA